MVSSTHMLPWFKINIRVKFKGTCIKVNTTKSLQQANKTVLFNKYFSAIFFYQTLKIFKEYSKVKQGNKSEYWAVCRQLVLNVISLLIKDDLVVFQCI